MDYFPCHNRLIVVGGNHVCYCDLTYYCLCCDCPLHQAAEERLLEDVPYLLNGNFSFAVMFASFKSVR